MITQTVRQNLDIKTWDTQTKEYYKLKISNLVSKAGRTEGDFIEDFSNV